MPERGFWALLTKISVNPVAEILSGRYVFSRGFRCFKKRITYGGGPARVLIIPDFPFPTSVICEFIIIYRILLVNFIFVMYNIFWYPLKTL